jgi:hypothetical protein
MNIKGNSNIPFGLIILADDVLINCLGASDFGNSNFVVSANGVEFDSTMSGGGQVGYSILNSKNSSFTFAISNLDKQSMVISGGKENKIKNTNSASSDTSVIMLNTSNNEVSFSRFFSMKNSAVLIYGESPNNALRNNSIAYTDAAITVDRPSNEPILKDNQLISNRK